MEWEMKEKFLSWGTLLCLGVLTSLFLVHALAIFPGVPAIRWFFRESAHVLVRLDAPAWAQAGTAAIAIVAGAVAVAWQQRQRAEEERCDQIRRFKILSGALFNCRIDIEYLQHCVQFAGVPADRECDDIASQLEALRTISPFDYPNWPAFHAVESATRTFRLHEASLLESSRTVSEHAWHERKQLLGTMHQAFSEAERLIGDCVLELNGALELVRLKLPGGHMVYAYGHPLQRTSD
jgi:hypothetical protein